MGTSRHRNPASQTSPLPSAKGQRRKLTPPINIDLNLEELIRLEEILEHKASGLIKKGPGVLSQNANRPKNVLSLVHKKFKRLEPHVNFRLSRRGGGDRYLISSFSRGMDPELMGRAALGLSRTKTERFRPDLPKHRGVTAYIYEGAIGNQILELLGSQAIDISNIFASMIAHEVGHNLGLEHDYTPKSIMFDFGGASDHQKKIWLQYAAKDELEFRGWQIVRMKLIITGPWTVSPTHSRLSLPRAGGR
ncbi:MAG: matrixin family metalloprotease [candidate division Zixibacteria bacterium]|nr:matrixin family metalloprotease [candidate division Zixibacteria bacterium]